MNQEQLKQKMDAGFGNLRIYIAFWAFMIMANVNFAVDKLFIGWIWLVMAIIAFFIGVILDFMEYRK